MMSEHLYYFNDKALESFPTNKEILMLIYRTTEDMFTFSQVCDYMVAPVNLMGKPGKGLVLEFRRRAPLWADAYIQDCQTRALRIGTVTVFEDTGESWGVINLPTKDHYANHSEVSDLKRGLEALRNLLLEDKYRDSVIGLPMLGCGLGLQDYPTVLPLMKDYLEDIPATVFVSMAPKRYVDMQSSQTDDPTIVSLVSDIAFRSSTDDPGYPRYLVIAGPPSWGKTSEEHQFITDKINKVLAVWMVDPNDYTAIVSGGLPGVDQYVAGATYNQDYLDTWTYQITGKIPLVPKPNKVRHGAGANLKLGNLLCEIGQDFILFKPKGHNNNRLSNMQVRLNDDNLARREEGLPERRVAVYGERDVILHPEGLLIPTNPDSDGDL